MAFIFIGLAIYVLPILVFHYTINKYDNELDGMPFTAQELGQDILNDFDIKNVDIEPTEMGDHYDPDRKKIRIKKNVALQFTFHQRIKAVHCVYKSIFKSILLLQIYHVQMCVMCDG